jgi:hypothetical protein
MFQSFPLSSSDRTEFDEWLAGMVRRHGQFTLLVMLAEIGPRSIVPLASTYLHVIGDEVGWDEIKAMFESSGKRWDGAAFFPTKARDGGLVDRQTARVRLAELEAKIKADRMTFNDGHFFDLRGRRIEIEPIADT